MVAPFSDRITRVPPYSSSLIGLPFRVPGYHRLWPGFPSRSARVVRLIVTGLLRVRSPLLAESRLISFPPVTEMFQFTGFAPHAYEFSVLYRVCGGFFDWEVTG